MDKIIQARRERLVFRFGFVASVVAIIIVLVLTLLQALVRYTTNQNFMFLGGNELEVLTASAFLMLLGLSYIYRPQKHLFE
jgi:TRAP-type C4-dicarboxylate transport system permease small subunit